MIDDVPARLVDDILEGLRLRSAVFCRMTLCGELGFDKDALVGAPFYLMLTGEAWLRPHPEDEPIRLGPGDIVVLPQGEEHALLSRPDARTVSFTKLAEAEGIVPWVPGMRYKSSDLRFGGGEPVARLVSGVFAFGDHRRNPLFSALPPVLLLRAGDSSPVTDRVRSIAALLDAELASGEPGAGCVGGRLADILFIQVVRHYLSAAESLPRGWLRAMTDADIAPALALMQRAPERPWTVASLARETCMSRSRFALRFQQVVGRAPLDYLTDWRMYLAAGRLTEQGASLATVAASVGYRSDVTFSKAFKRWSGRSPGRYARDMSGRSDERRRTGER